MIQRKTLSKLALLLASCGLMAACQTATAVDGQRGSVDDALDRAMRTASMGRTGGQSLGYLEKTYKRNSDDPVAAINFATGLRGAGKNLRAATVLGPFANMKDSPVEAKTEFAAIQLAQGNYEIAEDYASKALLQDSQNAQAHHYMGVAQDAQGLHVAAETSFRKALDLWEGDPTSIMNNLALNLTSQNKLEEAASILEKAQAISPERVELERNLRIVRALQQSHGYKIPKPTKKPLDAYKSSSINADHDDTLQIAEAPSEEPEVKIQKEQQETQDIALTQSDNAPAPAIVIAEDVPAEQTKSTVSQEKSTTEAEEKIDVLAENENADQTGQEADISAQEAEAVEPASGSGDVPGNQQYMFNN